MGVHKTTEHESGYFEDEDESRPNRESNNNTVEYRLCPEEMDHLYYEQDTEPVKTNNGK
ncbi:hypothetical protein O3M35_005194 [Rhynocoris fuscipes]|uniref:Uncharacterized protein n=1 Tax=Rhynocoris fuscipes TaxID=488301 RepID=A0AAW1DPI8_9HEMI